MYIISRGTVEIIRWGSFRVATLQVIVFISLKEEEEVEKEIDSCVFLTKPIYSSTKKMLTDFSSLLFIFFFLLCIFLLL